jgi:putative resolvase
MKEKYYTTGEVAKWLGVSVPTIKLWENKGQITCIRTPGNHRLFPESEIKRILGEESEPVETENTCVVYARVSSNKQRENGNLTRQRERLVDHSVKHGYHIAEIIEETASGLNENRRGLKKLLDLADQGQFSILVIEFKDRLTRFGYKYLERYLTDKGVTIEVVEKRKVKQPQEELAEDLVAIITSFSAKLYGLRSQKFKKIKSLMEKDK